MAVAVALSARVRTFMMKIMIKKNKFKDLKERDSGSQVSFKRYHAPCAKPFLDPAR
jgi:hypothetical protein